MRACVRVSGGVFWKFEFGSGGFFVGGFVWRVILSGVERRVVVEEEVEKGREGKKKVEKIGFVW